MAQCAELPFINFGLLLIYTVELHDPEALSWFYSGFASANETVIQTLKQRNHVFSVAAVCKQMRSLLAALLGF